MLTRASIVIGVLLTLAIGSIQNSAYASSAVQIDESRDFDALIVDASYVRGALGAQECRSGALIDLSDGDLGHSMRLQVGHTYYFQNAWIYEGNPGQLFLLWYNSPRLNIRETGGCNPPPLPQPRASIRTDRSEYSMGDVIEICYIAAGHVEAAVYLPDGTRRSLGEGEDDGSEDCFRANSGPPSGRRRLVLTVSSNGRVLQTAETSYDIVGSLQTQPPTFWFPVSGVDEGIVDSTGSSAHRGPDLYAIDYIWRAFEGIDVYPALPGEVVYSDYEKDYGCTIVVRHSDPRWEKKYYSLYAHLQCKGLAPLGAWVDGNVPIGHMGMTGNGANNIIHLHFAVRSSDRDYAGTDALYGVGQKPFDVKPFMR